MRTRRVVKGSRAGVVVTPLVFSLATPAVAAPPTPTEPAPATQPRAVPPPVYDPQPQPLPPAGRKPDPNRGLGLMIPGLCVFVASFGVSLLFGALLNDWNAKEKGRPLLLPLAGPFISLARTDDGAQMGTFAALGTLQIVGLGMAIGGGVWWHRERKRPAQLSFAPTGLQIRF